MPGFLFKKEMYTSRDHTFLFRLEETSYLREWSITWLRYFLTNSRAVQQKAWHRCTMNTWNVVFFKTTEINNCRKLRHLSIKHKIVINLPCCIYVWEKSSTLCTINWPVYLCCACFHTYALEKNKRFWCVFWNDFKYKI